MTWSPDIGQKISPTQCVCSLLRHSDRHNSENNFHTPAQLQEISNLRLYWVSKTFYSKRTLPPLLGSLLYITKCFKPARYFLNRMLALLRAHTHVNKILLDASFFKDLSWFNTFLATHNGVAYYDHKFSYEKVYL